MKIVEYNVILKMAQNHWAQLQHITFYNYNKINIDTNLREAIYGRLKITSMFLLFCYGNKYIHYHNIKYICLSNHYYISNLNCTNLKTFTSLLRQSDKFFVLASNRLK